MFFIFVIAFVIVVFVFLYFMLNKKKNEKKENNKEKEELYIISQERINIIKEKYKSTQVIKKVKSATKEDVEAFYKSQIDSDINK